MATIVASPKVHYEVPGDWLTFCDLNTWHRTGDRYPCRDHCEIIPLTDIEPLQRTLPNGLAFRKYKLVPLLLTFQSPECLLPAIQIAESKRTDHKYELINGFHRYCASLIVGYPSIPAIIMPHQDVN